MDGQNKDRNYFESPIYNFHKFQPYLLWHDVSYQPMLTNTYKTNKNN